MNNVVGLVANNKQPKIETYSMIKHDGGVNRARYSPFDSTIIASKSSDNNIYVQNYIQHSREGKPIPNAFKLTLTGHTD